MTSRFEKRLANLPTSRSARAVVVTLLACLIVCIVGLPVPPSVRKNASQEALFPCIDSPCGCSTAEQCWDHCCCYSDAQKIAWAKKHHVTPPAFVLARHAAASIAAARSSAGSASDSCCSVKKAKSSPSCRQAEGQACEKIVISDLGQRGCCGKNTEKSPKTEEPTAERTAGSRVVFWTALQRCRGIDLAWTLLHTGWIPLQQDQILIPEPLLIGFLLLEDSDSESIFYSPDPPVPWLLRSRA